MWQPEKPKVSWIEWTLLVFVIVGSLIGIVYTLVSVDLVDIGGGESVPQPTGAVATPVATRNVAAPTDTPMPADTPIVVSTAALPTRQPLVVRETTQPGWVAVISTPNSHSFQDLGLGLQCSGASDLLIYIGNEKVADVDYWTLVLIQQGSDSIYLRVGRKCGLEWLVGDPNPDYAVFYISKYGDRVGWGCTPNPGSYLLEGKIINQKPPVCN